MPVCFVWKWIHRQTISLQKLMLLFFDTDGWRFHFDSCLFMFYLAGNVFSIVVAKFNKSGDKTLHEIPWKPRELNSNSFYECFSSLSPFLSLFHPCFFPAIHWESVVSWHMTGTSQNEQIKAIDSFKKFLFPFLLFLCNSIFSPRHHSHSQIGLAFSKGTNAIWYLMFKNDWTLSHLIHFQMKMLWQHTISIKRYAKLKNEDKKR